MSAKDRVIMRKQEKQRAEERERQELLLAAEAENRRIRAMAYYHGREQYTGATNVPGLPLPAPGGVESNAEYEFDARGRQPARPNPNDDAAAAANANAHVGKDGGNKGGRHGAMNMEQLAKQLDDVVGSHSRFTDNDSNVHEYRDHEHRDQERESHIKSQDDGRSRSKSNERLPNDYYDSSEDDRSDEDVARWDILKNEKDASEFDEEEDVRKSREAELQAELNIATKRCQELKKTLQETKSFVGSKAGGGASINPRKKDKEKEKEKGGNEGKLNDDDTDDDNEDEDVFDFDEEDDDETVDSPIVTSDQGSSSSSSSSSSRNTHANATPLSPGSIFKKDPSLVPVRSSSSNDNPYPFPVS